MTLTIPSSGVPLHRRLALCALRGLPGSTSRKFHVYDMLTTALGPREKLVRPFFGGIMRCDVDDVIGKYIYHFGVWEPHLSTFIKSRLRPGDVFCDIGAHIGYYSLLASRAVGSSGAVVAIEAAPWTYAVLLENLRLNRAENVRPVNIAVAAHIGTITLYRGPRHNSGLTTTVATRGFEPAGEVPARPLFDILTDSELASLRLVKLDVEGAEGPILTDIADRINRLPRALEIIAETSGKNDGQVDATLARFIAAGFELYEIPNSANPRTYLKFTGPEAPVPLHLPLVTQKDVLLSRDAR